MGDILITDDERDIRELIADILQDEVDLKRAVKESQLEQEDEDWKRALQASLATTNSNVSINMKRKCEGDAPDSPVLYVDGIGKGDGYLRSQCN